jgi:hypothetical protein
MTDDIIPLDSQRHAQDLRDTWQARVLAEDRGKAIHMMMAVLFHSYKPAMQILLRVVFPKAPIARNGWTEISLPFLYGPAKIDKYGRVLCGLVDKLGHNRGQSVIYETEGEMLKDVRDLADRLKLTDDDRVQMVGAVKQWIVADRRIDHLGNRVVA